MKQLKPANAKDTIVLDLVPSHQIIQAITKEFGPITAYEISNESGYSLAVEATANIKAKAKELEESRKALTKPLDDAKKTVMDLYREPSEQLARAERIIKSAILAFQQKVQREREAARLKAEAEARAEAERQAQALAKEAEEALNAGHTVQALEKIEKAENVYVIPAPLPELPKLHGATVRANWKHRVIDPNAVPRQFCTPDDKLLAALAKSQKDKASVPGVEFYNDANVAIPTAR